MPRWPPRNGDVPGNGKYVPNPPVLTRDGRLSFAERSLMVFDNDRKRQGADDEGIDRL